MKNLSFENGWETLPPTGNAGWLQNQRPNDWQLTILEPGAILWDSTDAATGEPECVHKLAKQLPPSEQPGGNDPLILDGETVYKVFHSGAAYGVELRQVTEGLKPGSEATMTVKVRVHDHEGEDPYGAEFRMMTNGKGGWWHKDAGQLVNFKWVERQQVRTIGDDGRFELVVQVKTKYPLPVDFFFDDFEFIGEYDDGGGTEPEPEPEPEPLPGDIVTELWEAINKLQESQEVQNTLLVNHGLQLDDHERRIKELEINPPQVGLNRFPLGVDVSYAQGYNTNWPELAAHNVVFAFIRAGSGKTPTDYNFAWNWNEANLAGIAYRAPYWFLYPASVASPETQARNFAQLIPDDCLLYPRYDLESADGFVPEAEVIRFLDEFKRIKGYRPRVYTSAYMVSGGGYSTALDDGEGWFADYGDNASIPNDLPILPAKWQQTWKFWQWTSKGGGYVGHVSNSLDLNWFNGTLAGLAAYSQRFLDAAANVPPVGDVYQIDFLRADDNAWRVIRRADGSGEDVWDLPVSTGFCRVKNGQQGEWYSEFGMWRYRDTSPAPDSQGNERLYIQTTGGKPGGQIAPSSAELGKVYTFYSDVQFYSKKNCQPLTENSGQNVPSTFQLVAVIDNYTFPQTGFTVDRLYKTLQTGEWQLYAIKDGRKIGWVGGGAALPNNEWSGELQELYFDRKISQLEPNKYCT